MAEFKKVITNIGQELITAAAFDSGELAVKYIVIGDANGESYEPTAEQAILVNQRNKLLITERIVNSPTRYTFLVQIPQDIDYYIIREIGLLDENDNLIEIAQMEQETYIQSDNLVQQLTIGIQIDVGQSSTVIVLSDTNIETASKDFVNNNFQNLNQKGQANGYCSLDGLGKIPQANIPDLFINKSGDKMTGTLEFDKSVEPVLRTNLNHTVRADNLPANDIWARTELTYDNEKKLLYSEGLRIATSGTLVKSLTVHNYGTQGEEYFAEMSLSVNANGKAFFNFPRCTAKPTTTSSASSSNVAVVVQNYLNGTSWYRVWSDGWIEQGGHIAATSASVTVNLLKSYSNSNYTLTTGNHQSSVGAGNCSIISISKSSFVLDVSGLAGLTVLWSAAGY